LNTCISHYYVQEGSLHRRELHSRTFNFHSLNSHSSSESALSMVLIQVWSWYVYHWHVPNQVVFLPESSSQPQWEVYRNCSQLDGHRGTHK
jgi:hypothetical protein